MSPRTQKSIQKKVTIQRVRKFQALLGLGSSATENWFPSLVGRRAEISYGASIGREQVSISSPLLDAASENEARVFVLGCVVVEVSFKPHDCERVLSPRIYGDPHRNKSIFV